MQRRREDRRQRDHPEHDLARHARAGQRVRVDERERHRDRGDHRRDPQRVPDRAAQRGRGEVLAELREADEGARPVLHAHHEDRRERREQEQRERRRSRRRSRPCARRSCQWTCGLTRDSRGAATARRRAWPSSQPRTRSAAGGRLTVTACPDARLRRVDRLPRHVGDERRRVAGVERDADHAERAQELDLADLRREVVARRRAVRR